MLDYIKKRIKETNESLKVFKEKARCIHGLLGELAVLLEIKCKIEKEISESQSQSHWVVNTTNEKYEDFVMRLGQVERPEDKQVLVRRVSEEVGNEWCLFWTFLKTVDGYTTFRFCPRPYQGNSLLKGFEMTFPDDTMWSSFYDNVLMNKSFIEAYWGEYRLSFDPNKYWFKLVDTFGWFEGCPYDVSGLMGSSVFSEAQRLSLMDSNSPEVMPRDYRSHVESIVGKMEAWDYKEFKGEF
jgi:hypothetical protein